jgi:predicted RNA-binding Zn ribbon-like protein
VQLNPYGADAVAFAADLAADRPATPAALADRCRAAGVALTGPVTPADLAAVHALLDRWDAVVDADGPDARARLLNALLATAAAHPRLTGHDGHWHLHFRDDDLPPGRVVAALVAVGTALHLTGRGMHRLGRCARPGCGRAFADTSRTGRRRYCTPACANRDAVRRHRARRAAG